MSDEEARVVYEDARLGQSVEPGKNLAVLVDFDFRFTDLVRSIGSDTTAGVEATKRVLDAVRTRTSGSYSLHRERVRKEARNSRRGRRGYLLRLRIDALRTKGARHSNG